jgi:hypothetical protein
MNNLDGKFSEEIEILKKKINIINAIYDKPIVNIIPNGENLKAFPLIHTKWGKPESISSYSV